MTTTTIQEKVLVAKLTTFPPFSRIVQVRLGQVRLGNSGSGWTQTLDLEMLGQVLYRNLLIIQSGSQVFSVRKIRIWAHPYLSLQYSSSIHCSWHHDIQRNDTQHHGTRRNDNQHNDNQHNDTQHYGTQQYDTQRNDTKHNYSITILRIMA